MITFLQFQWNEKAFRLIILTFIQITLVVTSGTSTLLQAQCIDIIIVNESPQRPVGFVITNLQGDTVGLQLYGANPSFCNLQAGQEYILSIDRPENDFKEVSSLDLYEIEAYINGGNFPNNYYQILSMDGNGSQSVSISDILFLRQQILLDPIQQTFLRNTWHFIDAQTGNALQNFKQIPKIQFTFIAPGQPLYVNAIKTGRTRKVEYYHTPSQPKVDTLFIQIAERTIKSGDILTVPVRVKNFKNMIAFQFGLGIDKNSFNILGFDKVRLSNHTLNQNAYTTTGRFDLVWFQHPSQSYDNQTSIFEIHLKAKKDGKISQMIQLDTTILPLEAVRKGYEFLHIALQFTDIHLDDDIGTEEPGPIDTVSGENIVSDIPIFANRIQEPIPSVKSNEFSNTIPLSVTSWPVPFSEQIMLRFELQEQTSGSFYILDAMGNPTYTWHGLFQKGENRLSLPGAHFNGNGIYFYKILTPFHSSLGTIMKN